MSTAKIKDALIGATVLLATIYALNQVSFTRGLVQKALTGA